MSRLRREHYRPIHDYGLIGDCNSAALVASDGSIDWWCPTRFDGPSVFAAVLDREKGGHFRVWGGPRAASTHQYVQDTNILRTTFHGGAGSFELLDFMPVSPSGSESSRIYRLLRGLKGESEVSVEFAPRFDYGRVEARLTPRDGHILATGAGQTIALTTPATLERHEGGATGTFTLREGEEVAFALAHMPVVSPRLGTLSTEVVRKALDDAIRHWQEWIAPNKYRGPYRDAVVRSALVLKLLTYERTGAVIAAPTASLPEWIGGERNWDYRYSWVRDAIFAIRALDEVGHEEEGRRFVEWLVLCAERDPAELRVLYPVGGEHMPPEQTLDHLEGYRRSTPVRIGNAAEEQFQLDVYGELMEGLYHSGLLHEVEADSPRWAWFRRMADFVADNWRKPDQGIWEFRSAPRHFVFSKVMSWAALDRMSRVARERDLPGAVERWAAEAEAIRDDVMQHGYSEKLGAFRQSYEDETLDASNLLLPLVGFLPPDDPWVLSTIDRTIERLTVNGLVYRYLGSDDGVAGSEATFVYCTFWLVEALALAGRLDEARHYFENVLARASPLGLFAEEIDPATGEHLGNYPQGFPHIGLIRAARRLAREAAKREVRGAPYERKARPA